MASQPRSTLRHLLGVACATWAIGLPLAIIAVVWGLDVVTWVLRLFADN